MTLTESLIRKAKPREKPYKLSDGKGLYLLVNPTGSLWWRFRYRFGGKQNSLSLGVYPDVSLNEARKGRDEACAKIKAGIDPSEERREAKRNASQKPTGVTLQMTLSESGGLTITTNTRRMVLTPTQTEALRFFLIASPTDDKEKTC